LRALEQAMLRQDPNLAAPSRTADPAAPPEDAERPRPAARLTSFVGRDRERAALAELLGARSPAVVDRMRVR
jgi:hypothetical protein